METEEKWALLDSRIQELEKGASAKPAGPVDEKLAFLDSIIQVLENVGPVEEKLTTLDSRIQELEKLAFLDSRIQQLENGSSETPAGPVQESLALLDSRIHDNNYVTQKLDSRIKRLESMTASRIKQLGSSRKTQNVFVEGSDPLESTRKSQNMFVVEESEPLEIESTDSEDPKTSTCTNQFMVLFVGCVFS